MTGRTASGLVFVLLALALSVPRASAEVAASSTPVQDRYAAPGPAGDAVTHQVDEDPFGVTSYELWYPTDLGPPGTLHPAVTWGNGSFEHPGRYAPTLRHLASWGFIVIAAWTDQPGTGEEMLGGVDRLIRYGADPESPLFGHVASERIAAAGHSQGAGGSIRAATAPGLPIATVVTFDLPNRAFTFPPDTKAFDPSRLQVPVLFLSGGQDQLISGTTTNREFFDSVEGGAGVALLTAADHNTIQDEGVGYRGYATAWLRYQLDADPEAALAFAGPHPELATAPGWQDQAFKGLTVPDVAPTTTTTSSTSTTPVPAGPTLPATGRAQPLSLAAALLALALLVRRTAVPNRPGGGAPGARRP